jgi:hypothetical protein
MKIAGWGAAPLLATLGLLLAQDIYAAPPAARAGAARLTLNKAAIASQRDTNPALNGSVEEWRLMPPDAILQTAADAARKDSNPALNGSVSWWMPVNLNENAAISIAWAAYEHCHWSQAFEGFAAHADAGDFHAARMALAMAKHGDALYGQTFEVPEARRLAWRRFIELELAGQRHDAATAAYTALDQAPAASVR